MTTLAYEEQRLVEALRNRNEAAFESLLDRYSGSMTRIARLYVRSAAVADEVVQETWLGVLEGIDRFEGRSSLKTWIFRILTNIAKTRGEREGRTLPFSALEDPDGPAVEPERFVLRHWASPPDSWRTLPEERLLSGETLAVVAQAIELLPPSQQAVITLRDVHGWSSEEVRNALDLSETNQRVLLHRARSKVRQALEDYFNNECAPQHSRVVNWSSSSPTISRTVSRAQSAFASSSTSWSATGVSTTWSRCATRSPLQAG